jgi:MFS family permease
MSATSYAPAIAPDTAVVADEQPLLANKDFIKVWAGETVSLMGTQVTQLALPLVAILTLHASPFDIGLLNASRYIPVVIVSLFAGVWLDRRRRRPALIASNLGRAVLIGMIPVAYALGALSIWLLCLLCIVTGALTVIFDVGLLSYVPSLVERRHLAESNGKLQTSWSLAGIVGPGAGGLLVGLLSAPVTLAVDAVSFLVSALSLMAVRKPEPEPNQAAAKMPVRASIKEGLATVFGSRLLRSLLTQSATFNLFQNALITVFLVYAVRVLGLSPTQLGVVVASMSVGALVGAFSTHRITKAVGLGRTLRITTIGVGLAPLLLVLPSGSSILAIGTLMASQAIYGFGLVVYNVNTVTLRQTVTPNRLLGRMNASYRLLLFGTIPVGAILGGALGEVAGLRPAMIVTVTLLMSPIIWTFFSPVYALQKMPDGPDLENQPEGEVPAESREPTRPLPPVPAPASERRRTRPSHRKRKSAAGRHRAGHGRGEGTTPQPVTAWVTVSATTGEQHEQ